MNVAKVTLDTCTILLLKSFDKQRRTVEILRHLGMLGNQKKKHGIRIFYMQSKGTFIGKVW